jgi:sterol desaturase/sphingolipid hydroxylase (fatty acid hydroxylase superfamily)
MENGVPGFWETYKLYLTKPFLFVEHWWQHGLFVILFLSLCFLVLESFLPKKKKYFVLTRKGFLQDFVYLFFYDFLLVFPIVVGLDGLMTMVFGEKTMLFDIMNYSNWIIYPFIFLMVDFVNWLGHVILHKVPVLWKFHKIHHAQKEIGFASTRHFHFMEYLVFRPLTYIPFHFFGITPIEYMVFQIWVSFTFTFLSHANIKVKWGVIKYIFITPDTHYWHHARNVPTKDSVNYASILTIWDHIFGFFYLPKNDKLEPDLGLYNDDTPDSFLGQVLHPFKTLFKKEEKPNFKPDKNQ